VLLRHGKNVNNVISSIDKAQVFFVSDPDKKLDIIPVLENSLQNMLPTVNVFVSSTIEELFHERQMIKNVLTPLGPGLYISIMTTDDLEKVYKE
jgi:hypothetical protein